MKLDLIPISKESSYDTIDTNNFITKAKGQKDIGKNIFNDFIREKLYLVILQKKPEARILNYKPIEDQTDIINERR